MGRVVELSSRVWAPDGDKDGANNAATFYQWLTLATQIIQPLNTSGADGAWGVAQFTWPGTRNITRAKFRHLWARETLNFTAFEEWVKPRYEAYKTDNANFIPLADMVAFLRSNVPWIKPSGGREGQPPAKPAPAPGKGGDGDGHSDNDDYGGDNQFGW